MSETKKFYDRYWKDEHIKVNSFDRHPGEWTDQNFRFHLDFFKPYVHGNALDFGCGQGQFAHKVRPWCLSVQGIDVCAAAIDRACASYPDVKFLLQDDDRLPYADCSFDTVFALDVFEHILDLETVLAQLNRVLKKQGNLLIATSELTRLKTILIALTALDAYFYPAGPHVRHFTRHNLKDLLARKGFEVVAYCKNRTYFGFIPQGQLVVATKVR